jgi:hypothetical protein
MLFVIITVVLVVMEAGTNQWARTGQYRTGQDATTVHRFSIDF